MKALLLFFGLIQPLNALAQEAVLERIEDGDTLVVRLAGQSQRVQLMGIDAPESQPNPKFELDMARTKLPRERLLALGQAASRYLQTLVHQGDVLYLHGEQRKDKYGRLVADVHTQSGLSLSEALIRAGHARPLHLESVPPDLRQALQAAWQQRQDFARWLHIQTPAKPGRRR